MTDNLQVSLLAKKAIIEEMDLARQIQILDEAVCFSFYDNVRGKGINLSLPQL